MQGIERVVETDMARAEQLVRDALSHQGFGVLTEIDVAAVLAAKIGVERAPLKILGACNPHLAHEALEADPAVATLLPCNVVLAGEGDHVRITAVDPRALVTDESLTDFASGVAERLGHALDEVVAHTIPAP
ncbi:MAG: DUF302 domain-containing protein [Acidimicrobiales bacterium]|nr:DUF302 domain-containing protein [Acidimicrobiales bacterium]